VSRSRLAVAVLTALLVAGCPTEQEKASAALAEALPLMSSDPARAAQKLEQATRLDPTLHSAFGNLARAHLSMRAFAPAQAAAEQAIALQETADYREALAHAKAGQSQWAAAITDYERALELDAEQTQVLVEIGHAHERLEHAELAEQAYRRAIDADARPVEARVGLAGLLVARLERRKSRALLEAARDSGVPDEGLSTRIDELLADVDWLDQAVADPAAGGIVGVLLAMTDAENGLEVHPGFASDSAWGMEALFGPGTGPNVEDQAPDPVDGSEGTIGLGRFDTPSGSVGTVDPRLPSTRLGRVEVQGNLARVIVRRLVRRHMRELRICYERALATTPDLEGRVALLLTISATGSVSEVEVASSTLADEGVGTCLAAAARGWAFPAPEGGVARARLPITFSP
jgi:TonB family protein